jgi:hypothetical protein
MAKDKCVLCGVETPYEFETHVDMRIGYIEGAGQLCKACYNKGTEREQITIPIDIIYNTPNDQELGSKVRIIYYQTRKNGY